LRELFDAVTNKPNTPINATGYKFCGGGYTSGVTGWFHWAVSFRNVVFLTLLIHRFTSELGRTYHPPMPSLP